MKRHLIFLPLLFLFISCTVTKRVHRAGFHVQWHKNQKASDDNSTNLQQTKYVDSDDPQFLFGANAQKLNDSITNGPILAKNEQKSAEIEEKVKILELASSKVDKLTEPIAHTFLTIPKGTNSTLQKSKRPLFWRISATNLQNFGIFLMTLGVIILLGSLMNFLGAFSGSGGGGNDNGNGGWFSFFLDLISISGWYWLLLFIVLFILILYLATLLVKYALGGVLGGLIVGISLLGMGLFFYILGRTREIEA